jgi:hypothetical protein
MPQFPYSTTVSGLNTTIQQLRSAFPAKVTADTLKRWNIALNNESSILQTLRFIGLLDDEGAKQPDAGKVFVLADDAFGPAFGELVKRGYASLFEHFGDASWELDRARLIGFFRGSDQTSARVGEQQAITFATLAALAGHGPKAASGNGNGSTPRARQSSGEPKVKQQAGTKSATTNRVAALVQPITPPAPSNAPLAMSVRIELNLPVSDKQEVYDNIFRSIRENLLTANA